MTAALATKPVKFSGALGQRVLVSYVDPCPGAANSDRIPVPCGRCVDRSGYIRAFSHVLGGVCFECNGTGSSSVSAVTMRKWAKSDAYARDFAAEIEAHHDAIRAENEAAAKLAEIEAAHEAAIAEDARLSAMVQGFLGNEGDKLADVPVTINVAKYIEGSYNRSSSMFIIATADSGHVVKIFGSSQTLFGLRRGDEVVILTAKVKKHDWHAGQDQTVLGFVKVSAPVEAGE
jgi:hypothetical protein